MIFCNYDILNNTISIIWNEINATAHAEGDTIIFIYYHPPSPVALTVPQWFWQKHNMLSQQTKLACNTDISTYCKKNSLHFVFEERRQTLTWGVNEITKAERSHTVSSAVYCMVMTGVTGSLPVCFDCVADKQERQFLWSFVKTASKNDRLLKSKQCWGWFVVWSS